MSAVTVWTSVLTFLFLLWLMLWGSLLFTATTNTWTQHFHKFLSHSSVLSLDLYRYVRTRLDPFSPYLLLWPVPCSSPASSESYLLLFFALALSGLVLGLCSAFGASRVLLLVYVWSVQWVRGPYCSCQEGPVYLKLFEWVSQQRNRTPLSS